MDDSFWGPPSLTPKDDDVAYFVELIRETTKNYGRKRKLQICTDAMKAITAFVIHNSGPREALALLDNLRADVHET